MIGHTVSVCSLYGDFHNTNPSSYAMDSHGAFGMPPLTQPS